MHDMADEAIVAKKEKNWAVKATNTLGIHHKELKVLAKEVGRDNDLAYELIDTGLYEARLLASKMMKPKLVTAQMAEEWVLFFDNWEICDSFCMTVFARTDWAIEKIREWAIRDEEYVKRSAFATMAAYSMADKKAENDVFEPFFMIIKSAADDERTYVKKAVNWALRNIGKRNVDLKERAIQTALEILQLYPDSKAANWIANDALKELEKEGVRISNYPKNIYG